MKTYFKYILAPTALAAFALTGCYDHPVATDTDESIEATYFDAKAKEAAATGCKYPDRRSVREFVNEPGVIVQIMKDADAERGVSISTYAIQLPSTTMRFTACELPDEMQRDGVKVVFSGTEKEIFPHERWMATPLELKSIRIQQAIDDNPDLR